MLWHKGMRFQDFKMHFLLFNFVSSEEKFSDAFEVLIKSGKIFFRCSSLNCIHKIWDFSYLDFSPKIICELHRMFADIFLFENSSQLDFLVI